MAASEVNQLVEKHLSLVQAIARKVKKTLSASIDFEDLVGYGSKGLVEAAERFERKGNVVMADRVRSRLDSEPHIAGPKE